MRGMLGCPASESLHVKSLHVKSLHCKSNRLSCQASAPENPLPALSGSGRAASASGTLNDALRRDDGAMTR